MKFTSPIFILAFVSDVFAHYNFPSLIYGGVTYGEYAHVRQRVDHYSNGPVTDISLIDIRCGKSAPPAPSTLPVKAGSTLGFAAVGAIGHPGPAQVYMAKVPSGSTAATWDGSGAVWFKVYSQGATFTNGAMTWGSNGATSVNFKIPNSTPNGDYLVKVEHIGLHGAGSVGGAQFYGSCGQVTVSGGGSGKPSPKVAFPGAYSPTDPGIQINIYWPVPTSYTPPGPAVWSG